MNTPQKYTRRLFLHNALLILGSSLCYASSPPFLSQKKSLSASEETEDFPSYLKLYKSGELSKRVNTLKSFYEDCHLCPRDCPSAQKTGIY